MDLGEQARAIQELFAQDKYAEAGPAARGWLRAARIIVEDAPDRPGSYRWDLTVRPHFKYMGAWFTLSLSGTLDRP